MLNRLTPVGPAAPLAKGAMADLWDGLKRADVWGRLGWLEIKRRYRRTVLGPFWNVISLAVFIATIGMVGAGLWNQDPFVYVPYLTAGMLVWLMISTTATEACTLFVTNTHLYRHARFDFSLLGYALVWRNVLVMLHHLLVYGLVVLALAPQLIGPAMLLVLPGIGLLMINGVWLGLLLGLLCLRFRDVQQVVISLVQIAMIITPILWPVEQLKPGGVRLVFVHLNPAYHCVEVVRAPLLGHVPTPGNYIAVVLLAVVGWAIALVAFTRFRKRIAYWS
jgi:ABC-type polysaccharide/polyol phosphate export permease